MLSPQSSVASDVEVLATANTKRNNLAISLLTGLRKKRTNFLKRGPPNSASCGEFHKEKKSKSGTISILRIKKGVQKARECYSR